MSEIQATCTVAFDISSLVNCHDFCFEIVRKTRCWVGESPEYQNVRTMEKCTLTFTGVGYFGVLFHTIYYYNGSWKNGGSFIVVSLSLG